MLGDREHHILTFDRVDGQIQVRSSKCIYRGLSYKILLPLDDIFLVFAGVGDEQILDLAIVNKCRDERRFFCLFRSGFTGLFGDILPGRCMSKLFMNRI